MKNIDMTRPSKIICQTFKNIGCYILFFIFIFENSYAQSPNQNNLNLPKLSLQECISRAKANNFQKKQSQTSLKIYQNNLTIAQNERMPKVSGNMVNYLNSGRSIDRYTNLYTEETIANQSYGIDVGLPIYQGGQVKNNVKINAINYNLAENDIKNIELNLTIEVLTAFLSVVNLEEQLVIANQQIALSTLQLNRLTTLEKEGLASQINILNLQTQLANDEMQKVNAENDLLLSKTKLLQVMNESSNLNFQIDRISIETDVIKEYKIPLSSILRYVLENNPSVKKIKGQQEINLLNTENNKAILKPTIGLGLSLGANYSSAAPQEIFVYDGKTKLQESLSNDYVLLNGKKTNLTKSNQIQTGYYDKVGYFDQLINNFNRILYLNLRIPIYDAGISKKRIENAVINQEISKMQLNETETKIKQVVELAYLNMQSSYRRFLASSKQVGAVNESFLLTQKQFEEGIINSTDYMLLKTQLDRVRQNQVQYKFDYILRTKILDFYANSTQKF
jgi:outer membrane protein